MTTTPNQLGYAFTLSLPPIEDRRLHAWADATPSASWDVSGGHVTLARFTGALAPETLVPRLHEACSGFGSFEAAFTKPCREDYWDKPGLEIVMLIGETQQDVARVLDLRARLLATFLPTGLTLMEGGEYVPHVTLTTGLPPEEALRLEKSAHTLDLRFTANEIVFWAGGEGTDDDTPADPPWRVVERLLLL
jgi:hypothetical protein